ncbi:hypothetical protein LSAT2_002739 [Lamellibrachia satsuma]|nr:hypothetical protein LSAT2_002739 [Lamellibrachia satsuma]
MKWGIGLGVVMGCIIVGTVGMCSFNRCSYICVKRAATAPPRPKLKLNGRQQNIRPLGKRTMLKTGNYTVEQSWDQMVVKFHNTEFYEKFWEAIMMRYKTLSWRHQQNQLEGVVQCSAGTAVGLRMLTESRVLIVTKSGNNSWVMNDFQNICKNLSVSENPDRRSASPNVALRSLTPRLPTTGEEIFDAGDYHVKISHSEVEVKFSREATFTQFKRLLLYRYPALLWSKYSQRDSARIQLDDGKTVTLNLWDDIWSLWLSGDGKRKWYQREFQDLYMDVISGRFPEPLKMNKSRPASAASTKSLLTQLSASRRSSAAIRDIPVDYTIKTLDTGGYEIEFAAVEFLSKLRKLVDKKHTNLKWREYTCRHVTRIDLGKMTSVSIHFASPTTQLRKIWVYDEPGCKEWLNGEFRDLYALAYLSLYREEGYAQLQQQSSHFVPVDETMAGEDPPMTPVESSV